ncbi:unnamed protein product [Brassica rapa subsp. trilocularis]
MYRTATLPMRSCVESNFNLSHVLSPGANKKLRNYKTLRYKLA